jgi:hypothetical protein
MIRGAALTGLQRNIPDSKKAMAYACNNGGRFILDNASNPEQIGVNTITGAL